MGFSFTVHGALLIVHSEISVYYKMSTLIFLSVVLHVLLFLMMNVGTR